MPVPTGEIGDRVENVLHEQWRAKLMQSEAIGNPRARFADRGATAVRQLSIGDDQAHQVV
jgi:hypothetical protein